MNRGNRRSQPGLVEVRTNTKSFEREGGGAAWSRGAADSPPGVERIGAPSTLRLVGCEPKPSSDSPRLGPWGRSIARSENRRMEHLARVLGLRSRGSDGWPPAAA